MSPTNMIFSTVPLNFKCQKQMLPNSKPNISQNIPDKKSSKHTKWSGSKCKTRLQGYILDAAAVNHTCLSSTVNPCIPSGN